MKHYPEEMRKMFQQQAEQKPVIMAQDLLDE